MASSCQSGGHLDAVNPQHRLGLDDDPLALEPVSLPEPHVDPGPGLGFLDDSGLHPDQVLPQQGPADQAELLGADQQHFLQPDPLPALRLDVALDQDQVFVGHLPLAASEVDHGEEAAEVLLLELPVHGSDHRRMSAPVLLRGGQGRQLGQRGSGGQVPADGALRSDGSGEEERLPGYQPPACPPQRHSSGQRHLDRKCLGSDCACVGSTHCG